MHDQYNQHLVVCLAGLLCLYAVPDQTWADISFPEYCLLYAQPNSILSGVNEQIGPW